MSVNDDTSSESNSNMESPMMESPYSSPSQQVPHLASFMTELTCMEKGVFLQIIEQPQDHFRFRYKSEMIGTHGCLLGKSSGTNKTKTHPTVELMNYTGRALIRCRLAQHNNPHEHPHKLLEEDQDRDVSTEVPEQGSYKVGFPGMGIIHTAKKDVPTMLYNKYAASSTSISPKELRARCENIAKNINLNIVRLKFSAHDIHTGQEICPPVFSEPIHNMKSAATNDLKICRMSKCCGRPSGGDDVFILVEKVNKKNIEIRFFELSEHEERVWTEKATFSQSDVHHQYAIVFRTPAYKNPQISSDVKVYIELVRPSDGRHSEAREFTYKATALSKQTKKRKANTSFSSFDSSSGGSIKSISEVPATVLMVNQNNIKDDLEEDVEMNEQSIYRPPMIPPANNCDLREALYAVLAPEIPTETIQFAQSPMLGRPNIPDPPNLELHSGEIERLAIINTVDPEERKNFFQADLSKYFESFGSGKDFTELPSEMSFINASLAPDSGRPKANKKNKISNVDMKKSNDYSATYKLEDGIEVKKLVKELCEMIRTKVGYKKQIVRDKLERLFDMRLSNGDTFLHMTLCNNQQSLEYIVKLIHSMKMTHLLNLRNHQQETILHLAIANDMPNLVSFLVSKGCDPMIEDHEGNNCLHYAVIYQACLEPLLAAIKKHNVSCDFDVCNNEGQSALHLAAVLKNAQGAQELVAAGARAQVRDAAGRTPLHLAAYDASAAVARALLRCTPPEEVDALDGQGNTALQIVCGAAIRNESSFPSSLEIIKLLLDKNANPLKREKNESAWKLVQDKPEIVEIMKKYVPSSTVIDEDIKSEPEDDFESADELEYTEVGLQDLSLYAHELCLALDASGAWRELATRLHCDSLLNWFQNMPSPTRTLLNQIKECNETLTSKSLALILEDMGQLDAANIIRRNID